ncbi:NF038132 family protein [Leptolyngbya ohadii]|uniref:NF038132 family protein n=1 Tax=Leptolyngbya ohadii TaxID=1962290 RepID=UPI000B59A658|nr:NF038132 family protein [Leptolyngbya ohadii]
MKLKSKLGIAAVVAVSTLTAATEGQAISLTGWTGVGNFGTATPNGVVTLPPGNTDGQYGFVSTDGGVTGAGRLPGVVGTNGSRVTSPLFAASAGDSLKFFFNYVTSDGTGDFTDYAWAQLLDAADNPVALLFTGRTTPDGNTSPGFGLPVPVATLLPAATPIIPGGPVWSALGGSSGACFEGPANGCGYTGWIEASYNILAAGNYRLQFGVTNVGDTLFESGLAFDGATIAGNPITPNPIPTPAMLPGLVGMAMGVWRKRKNQASAVVDEA